MPAPESTPPGLSFKHHHAPLNLPVEAAVSVGTATKKSQKIGAKMATLLTEEFQRVHEPILHNEVPVITDALAKTRSSQCNRFGCKLCDDDGKCHLLMYKQFNTAVKRRCARKPYSTMLANSEFVYLLSGYVPLEVEEDVEPGIKPPMRVAEQILMHNGWQVLLQNDYHGYFHHVDVHHADVIQCDVLTADGGPEYAGFGGWFFENQMSMLKQRGTDKVWTIRFFAFDKGHRVIGRLKPADFIIREVPCSEDALREIVFWNGEEDVTLALKPKSSKPRAKGKARPYRKRPNRKKRDDPAPVDDVDAIDYTPLVVAAAA